MVRRGDAGRPALIDRHVSRQEGTRLVGTDPDEWFEGAAAVEFLKKGLPRAGAGVRTLSDLQAFSEGTVGWAVTRFTLTLPDGSSLSPRWSAVFRREDGDWKFVQRTPTSA